MNWMLELEPGAQVILTKAPLSLLRGLPPEDQAAIRSVVGQPVTFARYDHEHDQAELEFTDKSGDWHMIWVAPALIKPI